MAHNLSDELRQAIDASDGAPVEVVHPQTQDHYVVIRAEIYERLKNVLDMSEPTEEEKTLLLQRIGKSIGWEDSSSDSLI